MSALRQPKYVDLSWRISAFVGKYPGRQKNVKLRLSLNVTQSLSRRKRARVKTLLSGRNQQFLDVTPEEVVLRHSNKHTSIYFQELSNETFC